MKRSPDLEPGVLQTFRLFIGVQLVVAILGVILHWFSLYHTPGEVVNHLRSIVSLTAVATQMTVIAVESGLLFVYLSLPGLHRRFNHLYLPIGIIWATAGPILSPYIELHFVGSQVPELFLLTALWQQTILLFIPLIVVSWQFSIIHVALYCGLTAGINIVLLFARIEATDVGLLRSMWGILFIQAIAFLLVGHMVGKLVDIQRVQRRRLTEANERLAGHASTVEQLTISRERNRMARELHDVLAHTLSGVAVELEGLRAVMGGDPQQASALLDHSLQAVRDGLTETRRALVELRAKPLEDLGLVLAVKTLAESFSDRAGPRIETHLDENPGDFPPDVEQCVYRLVQESLTNIADHAGAKNVMIVLKGDRSQIELLIRDDGRGFDPQQVVDEKKYGLRGMRERAEMVGGKLSITSRVGEGTQITFSYGSGG